jgi:hypothetical protein
VRVAHHMRVGGESPAGKQLGGEQPGEQRIPWFSC